MGLDTYYFQVLTNLNLTQIFWPEHVFTYIYEDSFIDQRILQLANEIHGQCA